MINIKQLTYKMTNFGIQTMSEENRQKNQTEKSATEQRDMINQNSIKVQLMKLRS